MSDLTITNAGVSVTAKSPGSSNAGSSREIIRIKPTLAAAEHHDDDVLFTNVEIPNAVQGEGGISMLKSAYLVDYGKEDTDVDVLLVFTEKNTNAFGTVNATCNISDADFEANKPVGYLKLDGQATVAAAIDNNYMHQFLPATGTGESSNANMYLKADDGSTSVYMHAVITGVDGSTNPTYADGQYELIFHIEY
tara:strand:- start:1746 stop:2327 length:582 start_codon:yes stop_codon:yes gene_type:complete